MRTKNKLTVKHPVVSAQELSELSEDNLVSRSSHVGNQNLRELVLLTNFNLRQILVDTIHAEDKYARPAHILNGQDKRLASRSQAKNKIPSKVPIRDGIGSFSSGEINGLIEQSETVQDLHAVSIGRLALKSNPPILLSEMLDRSGDRGLALMEATAKLGGIRRTVDESGKIQPIDNASLDELGVFGLNDASPKDGGALLPLEGMMALDILEAQAEGQSETVFHLGGKDMCAYTRDQDVMSRVDQFLQATCSLLEQKQEPVAYSVIDISNADRLAASCDSSVKSQYDLIERHSALEDRIVEIPDANYDTMLGGE